MEETGSKVCKMCYQEIDGRAKKCPYCQHFQSKMSMVVSHPVVPFVPLLLVFLSAGFMLKKGFEKMLHKGDAFTRYKDQVTIGDTELKFGESKSGGATVVVMGSMINSSSIAWEDVQLEVRFYDSEKKLIDTDQERKFSFVIPANDVSTFKLSIPREFPVEQYVTFEVRILSARDARAMW